MSASLTYICLSMIFSYRVCDDGKQANEGKKPDGKRQRSLPV